MIHSLWFIQGDDGNTKNGDGWNLSRHICFYNFIIILRIKVNT